MLTMGAIVYRTRAAGCLTEEGFKSMLTTEIEFYYFNLLLYSIC